MENNSSEEIKLKILADILEKADIRKYTCVNGFGYSKLERDIVSALSMSSVKAEGVPTKKEISDAAYLSHYVQDEGDAHNIEQNFIKGANWGIDRMLSKLAEKDEKIKILETQNDKYLDAITNHINFTEGLKSKLTEKDEKIKWWAEQFNYNTNNYTSELKALQSELEASKLKISEWREDYNTLGEELEAVKLKYKEDTDTAFKTILELKSQAEKMLIALKRIQTTEDNLSDDESTWEEIAEIRKSIATEAISHYKLHPKGGHPMDETVPTDIKK